MGKEEDHHALADTVATDADGKRGGGEDEKKNEAGERIIDREAEGTGEEGGGGETEEVDGDGHEDGGDGGPAAVHGIPQGVEEIEDDGTAGKPGGQGQVGEKAGDNKTENEQDRAGGTQPGNGLGKGGESGVLGEAGGGGRKQGEGQSEENGHAKDAVEQDGEGGAGLAIRKPAKEIVETDGIAPGGTDEEKIEEEPDKGEVKSPKEGEIDFLQAKQEPETDAAEQDGDEGEEQSASQPSGVGGEEALTELGPIDLAGEKSKDPGGDGHPDPGGQAAQQRGGWFWFHHARLARTSSADTSGESSRER